MDEKTKALLESVTVKKFGLHSHSSDRTSFCFICERSNTQNKIYLDIVVRNGEVHGCLKAAVGMVVLSAGPFSWPHPDFRKLFWQPLRKAVLRVESL